jgi:hypothetical protein
MQTSVRKMNPEQTVTRESCTARFVRIQAAGLSSISE